jgi:hypothetical protein
MKIKFDFLKDNSSSDMCVEHLTVENDRFELLSAYIDGEVTVAQKEQVQQWLNEDPSFKQLYQRLLRLNYGFQSLPTPVGTQSHQQITNKVFERIENNRWQKIAFWGGTAIAALTVGIVSWLLQENKTLIPQMAEQPTSVEQKKPIASNQSPISEPSLMIAINRPPVPIPKAPQPTDENWENP